MSANYTATSTAATANTTLGAQEEEFDLVKYELGAILGVAFGVLVSVVVISVAGIAYLRRKRDRDREYRRNTQVMRESAKSAGVYRDTTTDDRLVANSYRETGKDYKTLYKNPNLYESDSDEF